GLRRTLRQEPVVDPGHVRRGDLPKPQPQDVRGFFMQRVLIVTVLALTSALVQAQQDQQPPTPPGRGQGAGRGGPGGPAPVVTGRAQAPWDLSGYWVAMVTDDWRYRMLTPPKGNADYMPVN